MKKSKQGIFKMYSTWKLASQQLALKTLADLKVINIP